MIGSDKTNLSGNIGLGARTALLQELSELDSQTARLAQKRGRMLLEDAASRLTAADIANVSTRMRNGEISETVQESERDADLIVIGKRGEAADFDSLHPGSNLERVIRSCKKPVLVASRAFSPIERIVIAFDGGASAKKAVKNIATTPLFKGLPVKVVTVGEETKTNRDRLAWAEKELAGSSAEVSVALLSGQAEIAIAEDLDNESNGLLVMGAYGHSRIRHLIIGSTTTAMIASCKSPVMLYR